MTAGDAGLTTGIEEVSMSTDESVGTGIEVPSTATGEPVGTFATSEGGGGPPKGDPDGTGAEVLGVKIGSIVGPVAVGRVVCIST